MIVKQRYLTKGRFKLGLECPTKLFYTKNLDYADQGHNDPFMQALAKGGYQVGEMAKYKYCDDPIGSGITVESLVDDEALRITQEKLNANPRVVIAEGAFCYNNLFMRADIVVRDGQVIKLIEVKSKSIQNSDEFLDKNGKPMSKWSSYLYDIAFQTYVMQKALPNFEIKPYLLLVNKDALACRDGLNQLFKVKKNAKGRTEVVVPDGLTSVQIGNFDLLREVPMGEIVQRLYALKVPNDNVPEDCKTLERFIDWCANLYVNQERHWSKPELGVCKKCTFVNSGQDSEKKCGFTECWSNHQWNVVGQVSSEQLNVSKVTELWMGLGGAGMSKKVMDQNVPFLSLLEPDLLRPATEKNESSKPGMTPFERRGFQIEASRQKTKDYIFLKNDFEAMYQKWDYPLNMIDFETSVVALTYFKGMAPYETVAFQFSHHIMHADGRVEHYNDFISWEAGEYPNLAFVRALKYSLESNKGTIFRYATHENTVLNKIKRDITLLKPVDQDELLNFIDEITEETKTDREGSRNMVDMADLVRKVYYSPHARGSNSIKRILPAIIHDCLMIAERFSQPNLYGKGKEYSSLNFESHVWIMEKKSRDPYKTLSPLTSFEGVSDEELFDDLGEVSDGSAAMTAYNKLQLSFIGDAERLALRDALLQYCELDTLAMVMLLQGLMNLDNRENYADCAG